MPIASPQKQVNVRLRQSLYTALEAVARSERRSVPQTARLLLEDGLRQRTGVLQAIDDTPSAEIASLAMAGGAFDWLADEPDIYDESCGEAL